MGAKTAVSAGDEVESELFREFQEYLALVAGEYEVRVKDAVASNASLLERMHKKNADDLGRLAVMHEKAIRDIEEGLQKYTQMHFKMSQDAYETNRAKIEKLVRENGVAAEGIKNVFQLTTSDLLKKSGAIYEDGRKRIEDHCNKLERSTAKSIAELNKTIQVFETSSTGALAEHKDAFQETVSKVVKKVDRLKVEIEKRHKTAFRQTVVLVILCLASLGMSLGILLSLH